LIVIIGPVKMQNKNDTDKTDITDKIIKKLVSFSKDPLGFVKFAFDWGHGELANRTIELWQEELLIAVRDGLKTVDEALQFARASGHGIGKSCFVSWIILWAISTKINTRGIVTANTDTQLRTKTWPELHKWHSAFIGKDLFEITATAIYAKEKGLDKTWRIDCIPWSEHNTEAFAGLHNQGNRILVIMDEASAIHDKIWEVVEGAMTDQGTERLWFAFGNPTRNVGRFAECFGRFRHRWNTQHIDSRSVSFTDKKLIEKWSQDYGDDSDFFRVRVKGIFPRASDRQFIPLDIIEAAKGRGMEERHYIYAPVIIGVDPAWSGSDESVIYMRQGRMSKMLAKYSKLEDDVAMAGFIAKFEDEYNADAVFVDMGYGTGVVSVGRALGRKWQLIPFASKSSDLGYLNKRAEMWALCKQWLKEGGCLPPDEQVAKELAAPEAFTRLDGKIQLESKEDIKKRVGFSPNRADALCLTFAFPVNKKKSESQQTKKREYDPLKD
jgi:hypothetical protein